MTKSINAIDDANMVADLERDIKLHEAAADRLEENARNRRRMAERARKGIEYIQKRAAAEIAGDRK